MAGYSGRSCPIDSFGNPRCCITAHPDRPHDKFCATCEKTYRDANHTPAVFVFLTLLVFAWLALVEHESRNPEAQPVSNTFQSSIEQHVPISNTRGSN